MLGLGVDLVGAECTPAIRAEQRRVDLEHMVESECGLGRIFVLAELADRRGRVVLADRLAEISFEGELSSDALGGAIRPDENAVRTPDLDRQKVRLAAQLRLDLERQVR